jgi:hypothetical protein
VLKSLIMIVSLALFVFGSEPVAFIKSIQGSATVKRDSGVHPVKAGEQLFNGDKIETAKSANMGISFNDGTAIAVGPESLFVIEDYLFRPSEKTFHFDVSLPKGKAVVETGKIGKLAPEKVRIKVPQGIIGVRGTKFIIEAE